MAKNIALACTRIGRSIVWYGFEIIIGSDYKRFAQS